MDTLVVVGRIVLAECAQDLWVGGKMVVRLVLWRNAARHLLTLISI